MKKIAVAFSCILALLSVNVRSEEIRAYGRQVKVETNNLTVLGHSSTSTVQSVLEWMNDNWATSGMTTNDVNVIIGSYVDSSGLITRAEMVSTSYVRTVVFTNTQFITLQKGTGPSDSSIVQSGSDLNTWTINFGTSTNITSGTSTGNVPTGCITMWPSAGVPDGWLECNGAAIAQSTYTGLWTVIGNTFGPMTTNAGSPYFPLPDLRGYFVRAWDHGRGIDEYRTSRSNRGDGTGGDNVGTIQEDAYESHSHTIPTQVAAEGAGSGAGSGYAMQKLGGIGTSSSGTGTETRPKNIYMMYIIKY